jgi:AraC-like DNA-binding protein
MTNDDIPAKWTYATWDLPAPLPLQMRQQPDCLPSLEQLDPALQKLVRLLVQAHLQPRRDGGAFVDAVIAEVYAHFVKLAGEPASYRPPPAAPIAPAKPRGGLAPWQERLVRHMVGRDLAAPVALADMARACGLSVSHFARAFKQSMGAPPHRWVLQQRVAKAQSLLQRGLALSDIALACGFNDQSHLSKGFKSVTGRSPRAWQRSRQDNARDPTHT